MPAFSVQDMITNIRDIVDDESASTHSDLELLNFMNGAVSYYDAFLAEYAEKALMHYRDISHDGSELQAVMPYLPRIITVERTSDSPRTETVPLLNGFRDRFPFISTSSGSLSGQYYVQNNQLAVVPQQATGATDRVWTVLRSPELHYGSAASSSTTTSLVLDTTPTLGNYQKYNDAYNFIPVMLTVTREINVIADHIGSSGTCTLQFTFANSPASAIYSILPVIDPEFHWLFIWQAVIIGRMRTDENKIDAVSERRRLEGLLTQRIRRVSGQQNKYVKRYGWA